MQNSKRKNEMRDMPPTSPEREAFFERQARQAGRSAPSRRESKLQKRATPDFSRLRGGTKRRAVAGVAAESVAPAPSRTRKVKVKAKRERLAKFDYPFFTIVIVLLAFGVVMMFSASYATAFRRFGDSYHYISRQLGFIGIGLIAMLVLSVTDYHIMMNKFIIRIGVAVSAGLMLIVRFTGTSDGGAERWIDFGGFTIQPSEILKFTVIVVFAYWCHTKYDKLGDLKEGFIPILIILLASCGLTLIQPHLSGTIIIFTIGIIMMFVGNCKVKHILLMILAFIMLAVMGLGLLNAMGHDYFSARFLGWQDPEADIRGATFQTYQSLVTIGSGGIFGLGLGNSRQKYAYLPESHNDFIFSIICEELGFVGAILVITLFILFVFRGFYIAVRARDKFGMLLAVGITSHLGVQALLNIGVVTNSLPNTGISLPFFSYGGSALIMQLAEIGVVLNISRKAAIE